MASLLGSLSETARGFTADRSSSRESILARDSSEMALSL